MKIKTWDFVRMYTYANQAIKKIEEEDGEEEI